MALALLAIAGFVITHSCCEDRDLNDFRWSLISARRGRLRDPGVWNRSRGLRPERLAATKAAKSRVLDRKSHSLTGVRIR